MATKKVVADHDFLIPEFKLTQVADINYEKLSIIRRSSDAVEVLSKYIAQKDLLTQISVNEFAFVLYLNKQNRVIGITNLSIGGLDSTLMDVRMVYSMAVKIGASSIIVAHNHPSQNLKPSDADIRMSKLISEGGKTLTIQVLDFLIITSSSGYYSFGDEGMMAKGGVFAKGGITEHGLRVGDTIVSEIDENTIVVENPTSGRRTINISTGHPMAKGGMSDKIVLLVKDKKGNVVLRTTSTNKAADYCGLHGRENFTVETLDGRRIMAKGGRMGFKALSEKVASHYAGKSVPTKYQPEYGKFYDADEAKTVGNKVAAKVYRLQQGK
jgi:DNA repair protein RadC